MNDDDEVEIRNVKNVGKKLLELEKIIIIREKIKMGSEVTPPYNILLISFEK